MRANCDPSRGRTDRWRLTGGLLAAALLLATLPPYERPASAEPAAPRETDTHVLITDAGFEPDDVTITVGETVHWTNVSSFEQRVLAVGGLLDSGPLRAGAAYSATIPVPGDHTYDNLEASGPVPPEGLHSGTVRVLAKELDGAAGDKANAHLPSRRPPAIASGDVGLHPRLAVRASRTRIIVGFHDDATVAQANAALAEAEVAILGGIPRLGMLIARARHSEDFSELTASLGLLRLHPAVEFASMSLETQLDAVPRRAEPDMESGDWWIWKQEADRRGSGPNWWLEQPGFPAAWNLLEEVRRRDAPVTTGIIDGAFATDHPDLKLRVLPELCPSSGGCLSTPNSKPFLMTSEDWDYSTKHGTHVAGTIGATFDNPLKNDATRAVGVDGANPVADMAAASMAHFRTDDGFMQLFAGMLDEKERGGLPDLRVINWSAGAAEPNHQKWKAAHPEPICGPGAADDDLPEVEAGTKAWCTIGNADDWLLEQAHRGLAARAVAERAAAADVMIVQGAGNNGNDFCGELDASCAFGLPIDAEASAQFAWASRRWRGGANPIVIVEAHDRSDGLAGFSNRRGDIAAPGVGIGSTVPGGYNIMQGTSMAAPVVTGLIGYLLAFDPSLGPDDVRTRLRQWGSLSPEASKFTGARFTWRMTDRLNRDDDADGIVDDITDVLDPLAVEPDGWEVELDACGSSVDSQPAGRYVWSVGGTAVADTTDCRIIHAFPTQGTHDVTLTVLGPDGGTYDTTQRIEVRDILIASMGDSVASGEGVPDIPGTLLRGGSRWQDQRCHRSAKAGPAQAARWLEAVDHQTAVTFVHTACSGARIVGDNPLDPADVSGGLLSPYEGLEPMSPALPPQVDQVDEARGGRDLDALLLSIGANDLRFSEILKACIKWPACHEDEGLEIYERREPLLDRRYQTLDKVLRERRLGSGKDVHITEYFDPTYAEPGGPPDLTCVAGLSADESGWASGTVVAGLNANVDEAARAYGWDYRGGLAWGFRGHGHCADDPWVVGILDSFSNQRDENGGFHPNVPGHHLYAKQILAGVRPDLPVTVRHAPNMPDVTPRLDAFATILSLPGAAEALVDVSDPSPDGNRRIRRTPAPDGTMTEASDAQMSTAQGYRTEPDGFVDMRDFRRFRDAWLASCVLDPDTDAACRDLLGDPASTVLLDGADDHPKKDGNFDGCVDLATPATCGTPEQMFSRFDFNGDGLLSVTDRRVVPLTADGRLAADRSAATSMDDLEVFRSQFSLDPSTTEGGDHDALRDLLRSADLEVHVDELFANEPTASEATITVTDLATNDETLRTVRRAEDGAVVTVPLTGASADRYEITATIDGTTTRAMPVEVDGLQIGEDRRVDLCAPHLALRSEPAGDIPADGETLTRLVATIETCDTASDDFDVSGHTVSFELTAENAGDAVLDPTSGTTDVDGTVGVWLQPSTIADHYTLAATADLGEGLELKGELKLRTIAETTVTYVWRQEILDWWQEGSTRWPQPLDPDMPDCTVAGVVDDYCIDDSRLEYLNDASTQSFGYRREGSIVGVADKLELTEEVVDSLNWSQSTITLSNPDGSDPRGQRMLSKFGVLAPGSGGTKYSEHALPDDAEVIDVPGGVLLHGLRTVGELGYKHALTGVRMCSEDPDLDCSTEEVVEVGQVMDDLLLVPRGDGSALTFADDPDTIVPFERGADGTFAPYAYCGTFRRDLTTEPGYRLAESSKWVEGATSLERDPDYDAGDRPMPVGPGELVLRYSFAAVAHQGEGTPPEPALPDCDTYEPPAPQAAFTFAPEEPGEGRVVRFTPDPFKSANITEFSWDLGDGTTSTEREPFHRYDDDGTYTAKLTVTDAQGRTASTSHDVDVVNLPPEASIDSTTGTGGRAVNVRFRMWDPGEADEAALEWRVAVTGTSATASGTDKAGTRFAQLSGLDAGTYEMVLTVTDKDGADTTATATLVMKPDDGSDNPPTGGTEEDDGRGVTGASCGTLDEQECAFLVALNTYRMENNLPVVTLSPALMQAAEVHGADMAANDFFDHTGSDGSTPADRARAAGYTAGVGENIYAGSPLAGDAMVAWKSSNGHNGNMLTPSWQVTGIARVEGGENGWTWVNVFGDAPDDTSAGGEDEVALAPGTESTDEPGRVAAASAGVPQPVAVGASVAEPAPPAHPPVAALSLDRLTNDFDEPFALGNRSVDSAGTPLAAEVDWGDGSPVEAIDAGGSLTHVFVGGGTYTVRLTATDAAGRVTSVERRVTIALAAPRLTWHGDENGSVDGETLLAARLVHPSSGAPLVGMVVTLRLGDHEHTAATDADGRVATTVTLDLARGTHQAEALFGGDDHWEPALVQRPFEVLDNRAPKADPGGPYVLVAGDPLSLDGSASNDPDPEPDRIVTYEWDLDGDGVYGETTGAAPVVLWEDVETLMCSGACSDGDYTIGLRVTDTRGARSTATTTVSLTADFALFVTPEVQALVPGRINSFTVRVVALAGFDAPVSLRVEGLPDGVTASFSPPTVQPSGLSSMKLTAAEDAETGEFDLTVIGEGGGLTRRSNSTVQVSFGLVPICYGAASGTVRDADTGAPVPGVRVGGATTDADGRYAITGISLGSDNSPRNHWLSTHRVDYWPDTGYVEVMCGAVSERDFTIVQRRYAEVTGSVVAGTAAPGDPSVLLPTDVPISGARVSYSGGSVAAGSDGTYVSQPLGLNHNNAPRSYVLKATAGNFWPQSKPYTATADDEEVIDFVLRPVCTGRITGGHFMDKETGDPIVGGIATLTISYSDIGYFKSLRATTDESGEYRFDVDVPLGVNNSPVTYSVHLSPPPGSPWGSFGAWTSVTLTGCDDVAGMGMAHGHVALPPVTVVGHLEGTVTDEETGLPIAGARVCSSKCATTDEQGRYRLSDLLIATWQDGKTGATERRIGVSASRSGYWSDSDQVDIRKDETSTLDLQLLAVRTTSVVGTVRDVVTGAPLPGARVSGWGITTSDQDGGYGVDGVGLGTRNAAVDRWFQASLDGYWPQSKLVRVTADGPSVLDFDLLKKCETASVTGVVVNALTQEPIAGATVNGLRVDDSGRFLLTNLQMQAGNQPWNYTLTAQAPGFHPQSKVVKLFCGARITLDFGRPQTAFGSIVGTVTDGRSGDPLGGVFIGSGFGASTTTAADGTYRFDEVPLGLDHADRQWDITAMPEGYTAVTQKVTVSRDSESRLDFAFLSNRPPTATPQEVRTDEGKPVDIILAGEDPDGDTLTYTVVDAPAHGALSGTAPDIVYTPSAGFSGEDHFTFRVGDGGLESEPVTVAITVDAVNHPPVLDAIGDLEVDEAAEVAVTISATDADGDDLTLTVEDLPGFAVFVDHGDGTGTLTLTPSYDDAGTYGPVRVRVSDGTDEVAEELMLEVRNVNRPPTVDLPEAGPILEGDPAITLLAAGADSDGDELTYTWTSDAGVLVAEGDEAQVSAGDGPASITVEVTVSDGQDTATARQVIEVLNVAPTVDAGEDRETHWGLPVVFEASVEDPSRADRAAGVARAWTFGDGSSDTAVWPTHSYADPGDYEVVVTATDKDGGVGRDTITVHVTKRPTSLVFTGDGEAPFGFALLSARLVDDADAATASLAGREVVFHVGGQEYRAMSDADGNVRVTEPVLVLPGAHDVEVRFAGDTHYTASQTTASMLVTSSPGDVTGGGLETIGRANSGFTVSSDGATTRGQLQLDAREHGVTLHVGKFAALGVSDDGTSAWFAGEDRDGGHVVVHVVDAGEPGTDDRFRLWLDGRLLTGDGELRRGNIQIHRPPPPAPPGGAGTAGPR